jgi:hypothetical protein
VTGFNDIEVDNPIALELAAGGRLVLPREGEEVAPRFQRIFGRLAERARESVRKVIPEARVMDLRNKIPNGASLETHNQAVDPGEVDRSEVVPIDVREDELPPIHFEPQLARAPLVLVDQVERPAERDAGFVSTMDPLEVQNRLSEMHRSDVRRKATRYVAASLLAVAVLGSAYGTLTYRGTPDIPRSSAAAPAAKPRPTSQTATPDKVMSGGVPDPKNSSAQLQGALSDVESAPAKGAGRNPPPPAVSDKKRSAAAVSSDSRSAAKSAPPPTTPTPPATKPTPPATTPTPRATTPTPPATNPTPPAATTKPPPTQPVVTSKSVAAAPAPARKWWANLFSKRSTRLVTTPKPAASPKPTPKAAVPPVTTPHPAARQPVTVSPPAKPDKKNVPVDVLSDVEGRLASGNEEAEIGLYSLARRIYHDAMVVTDAALSKYSQSDTLRSIRTQLNQADLRALRACQAENDTFRKSGRPTIPCE